MDKVKVKLNKTIPNEVEYNGVKIDILNYISIENYEILLNDIMNNIILNENIDNKISNIQIRFAKCIMELLTNIDISEFTADDYFATDIIDILKSNILNYSLCLDNIIKEYSIYQTRLGFGLIASKVPSEDGMKNIVSDITNMIQNMDTAKLETILKGIAFDKMPLANFISNISKKDKE
jgi:hypothetical protein